MVESIIELTDSQKGELKRQGCTRWTLVSYPATDSPPRMLHRVVATDDAYTKLFIFGPDGARGLQHQYPAFQWHPINEWLHQLEQAGQIIFFLAEVPRGTAWYKL